MTIMRVVVSIHARKVYEAFPDSQPATRKKTLIVGFLFGTVVGAIAFHFLGFDVG